MIRPSPELVAVARRWLEGLEHPDDETFANLFAACDELTYIGTDADEVFKGAEFGSAYGRHISEMPLISVEIDELTGYENGGTGWVFWLGAIRFAGLDNLVIRFRTTLIFALDRGVWRIVHAHVSNPNRLQELLGYRHVTMDALLHSARAAGSGFGQSGLASVMFTDIVGSSVIAAAIGDRAWADRVHHHLATIQRHVETGGGRMVKTLGDGTLSSFTSARTAIETARAIQRDFDTMREEPVLLVRIGLHTGDLIIADDDFFGTVVNKAARICTIAAPGEIRVSDATRAMIGDSLDFVFDTPISVPLRGLPGEHLLYRLEW